MREANDVRWASRGTTSDATTPSVGDAGRDFRKLLRTSPPADIAEAQRWAREDKRFADCDDNDVSRAVACWEAKLIASTFVSHARKHANLSQSKLATLLRCHKSYITQAESLSVDTKVPLDFLLRVSYVTRYPFVVSDAAMLNQSEPVDLVAKKKRVSEIMERLPLRRSP